MEKTGLRSLLGTGSDVRDSYRLLQTVQGAFKVAWQAPKRPQELGDPQMKAVISESGQLRFDIPGTLEYKLSKSQNQTVVAITGGIHPERLGRVKFKGFDRFDPWLQGGQPIQYEIRVEQTTRSGATYTSVIKINLIVDKVTPSPDIQYYSPSES